MVYVDGTKPWIYLWIFNCLWYLMIAFPEKSAELRLYVNAIECRILRDLEDVTKSLESSDGL